MAPAVHRRGAAVRVGVFVLGRTGPGTKTVATGRGPAIGTPATARTISAAGAGGRTAGTPIRTATSPATATGIAAATTGAGQRGTAPGRSPQRSHRGAGGIGAIVPVIAGRGMVCAVVGERGIGGGAIERGAVVVAGAEGGDGGATAEGARGAVDNGLLGLDGNGGGVEGGGGGGLAIVVVLAAHLGVLGNATLAGLATDEGAAHGAGDDAAGDEQDGGGEDDPPAPAEVRDEEEDVDEEGEQADEQGGQEENQQAEEVAGRMRRGVEVGGGGEAETHESEEGGDGVNDEDGGEGGTGGGGEIEVIAGVVDILYSVIISINIWGGGGGWG